MQELFEIIQSHNAPALRSYLTSHVGLVNGVHKGITPLMWAAAYGSPAIIDILAYYGADFNFATSETGERNALMVAFSTPRVNPASVFLLIQRTHIPSFEVYNAQAQASTFPAENKRFLSWIEQRSKLVQSTLQRIFTAIDTGDIQQLQSAINVHLQLPYINLDILFNSPLGPLTPLMYAALRHNPVAIEKLLLHGACPDFHSALTAGRNALMLVLAQKNINMLVIKFLSKNVDLYRRDNTGSSALYLSMAHPRALHFFIEKLLLSREKLEDLFYEAIGSDLPAAMAVMWDRFWLKEYLQVAELIPSLEIAYTNGKIDAMGFILAKNNALYALLGDRLCFDFMNGSYPPGQLSRIFSVLFQNPSPRLPAMKKALLSAAIQGNVQEGVEELLRYPMNLEEEDQQGSPPLVLAVRRVVNTMGQEFIDLNIIHMLLQANSPAEPAIEFLKKTMGVHEKQSFWILEKLLEVSEYLLPSEEPFAWSAGDLEILKGLLCLLEQYAEKHKKLQIESNDPYDIGHPVNCVLWSRSALPHSKHRAVRVSFIQEMSPSPEDVTDRKHMRNSDFPIVP